MFGLGKKDKGGKQVRIEHRGKYTRASRTGGVSLRAEKKFGPINATVNTSKGVRLSLRVARGTRIAIQNGKLGLIGRWNAGRFSFNLSKTGASASVKNKVGTFNFIKPQYSSFKIVGFQMRGKKAAQLQLTYIVIMGILFLSIFTFKLVGLFAWIVWLSVALIFDLITGFVRGLLMQHDNKMKNTKNR